MANHAAQNFITVSGSSSSELYWVWVLINVFFYIFDAFYVTESFNVNLLYALSTELQSVTQSQVIKLKNIYKPK